MSGTIAGPESLSLTRSGVQRLRAGDPGAGEQLEQAYRSSLTRFCASYLGRPEDVEDAVQEVFWKALRATTIPDNFRAWLYRMARNHCLNLLRARSRQRDRAPLPASCADATRTGVSTRVANRELLELMRGEIEALAPRMREPFRLHCIERLDYTEVSYVLSIPEKLCRSRVNQAIRNLSKRLSELEEG